MPLWQLLQPCQWKESARAHPAQETSWPPALTPFGSQQSRKQGPLQDPRQHRQGQGCQEGARAEVDMSHRVAVAFSQKVIPVHPLHCSLLAATSALHFFLLWSSKKYDCLGKKTPPFLAAECMKFSSDRIIWIKGVWRGSAHITHRHLFFCCLASHIPGIVEPTTPISGLSFSKETKMSFFVFSLCFHLNWNQNCFLQRLLFSSQEDLDGTGIPPIFKMTTCCYSKVTSWGLKNKSYFEKNRIICTNFLINPCTCPPFHYPPSLPPTFFQVVIFTDCLGEGHWPFTVVSCLLPRNPAHGKKSPVAFVARTFSTDDRREEPGQFCTQT